MGWRDWFGIGRRAATAAEERAASLAQFPYMSDLLMAPDTSGVVVTERTALNVSAYWNGIDIISSQVAKSPLCVYKRLPNDDREKATAYPVYKVIHDQPNEYMSAFVFWQTLMAHVLTWGNAYAEIEWDQALRPKALWPITPDRIYPVWKDGELVYLYFGTQTTYNMTDLGYDLTAGTKLPPGKAIASEDVLHVPGLGFDGIRGYSVVHMARRTLGLAIAEETFGASFFGNGAWPGLVLEHPKTLSLAAQERLIATVEARHRGADKGSRTTVLEEGMKANKIGIPPDDAQFLESREFQVVEIARWLNLPPHKLKHKYGERPGGNLEAAQIEFLTDTLDPWLTRIAQECSRKLIPTSQRGTYYCEHIPDAVLRLSAESKVAVYKAYVDMGVMSPETVAQKENLPPPPKPKPAPVPTSPPPATSPPENAPPPASATPPPAANDQGGDQGQRMRTALRALSVAQTRRFARREIERARKAAKIGPQALALWVDQFYASQTHTLEEILAEVVAVELARGNGGDPLEVARKLAAEYVERSKTHFLDLPAADLGAKLEAIAHKWETDRANEVANRIEGLSAHGGNGHVA